ncbi:peptidylprolyl isomerase [Lyngbya sp. CCY1209]|jgi:parvulin-like peptidyl-prolyl isomerase|uniref:peptidylprolyl isomerase n=1 Tax=Lyngbya sp. CCY1209 TaxID=2886103 RepID=UPI002D205A17|nr:peptidylprolyl isomerase [Lyngbya sp. CCY1209]MEB3884549.1 peptidylprolyl isomerase [Lyngbya sp. CCY1209]
MSKPFMTINDTDSISLGQSLKYLQSSGKFQTFLSEILRQYVIDKELQTREDVNVNPATVEQAVINFRMERNLSDPQAFQAWLDQNRMTYNAFHEQVSNGFKRETLKLAVVGPKLEEYFQERKPFLDSVVLSRIVVDDYEMAESLKNKILSGEATFEAIAREHSVTTESRVNGMMGAVSRATIPETIKPAVEGGQVGQIVGPFEVEGRWCLFRIEEFIEVSLETKGMKQRLQNELFDRWMNEQLKTLTVKLQISD